MGVKQRFSTYRRLARMAREAAGRAPGGGMAAGFEEDSKCAAWQTVTMVEDARRFGLTPQVIIDWCTPRFEYGGCSRLEFAENILMAEFRRCVPGLLKDLQDGKPVDRPAKRLVAALVTVNEMRYPNDDVASDDDR